MKTKKNFLLLQNDNDLDKDLIIGDDDDVSGKDDNDPA